MIGGPCPDLAGAVASRLMVQLQQAGAPTPLRVVVTWEEGMGAYRYRVRQGHYGALQYLTADLLQQCVGLAAVSDLLAQRVRVEAA